MIYFITAIGTNSGKTIASSIVTEALQADYYKPIQCGTEDIDSETVDELINNDYCRIFNSQFILKTPASPHEAAKVENTEITIKDLILPETHNNLVIEGAGGLLVPLNFKGETIADLIEYINCEVILVINYYLGCINHSLLTINELKRRNIKVKGIIFNGDRNENSEEIILQLSGYKKLLHLNKELNLNHETIKKYAIELMSNFYDE